jgi:hypothetical protein
MHWYIPFFLLSLYLFWSFCVAWYYFTRPTKQDKARAMKDLLDWRYHQLNGKHIDWDKVGTKE